MSSRLQRALLDTATILNSAANIARRAAVSIERNAEASGSGSKPSATVGKSATATSSTPWPSQSLALHQKQKHADRNVTSVPPLAPDGTMTEMKVINLGRSQTEGGVKGDLKSNDDLIRKLDDSLMGYFQDSEVAETGESLRKGTADNSSHDLATELPAPERKEPSHQQAYTDPSPEEQSIPHSVLDVSRPSSSSQPSPPFEPSSPEASPLASSTFDALPQEDEYDATTENSLTPLRSAKVPSSRIARLLHFGSLGAGLAWGAAGSYISGGGGSSQGVDGKQFMSDDNVKRLVDKLSTMRGAALKLGQFMSIQDSNLLPEQIEQVMLRVQNSANYMPAWQMERVMREDLGPDWRKSFSSFNDVPFASASIGQVHAATLSEDHPSSLAGQKVAVKVQFPGVRESIGSDLSNLRWLVSASALLPKGLFLDNTIRVMKRELDDECDYEREMIMCKRFGTLLNKEGSGFAVPTVVDALCSKRVLTCQMMKGRPLTQAARLSQEKRDHIARSILELSLRELFTFRLMQTDPNWTNFLYNERTEKIELIDFGATREYSKQFMDDWLCMLQAAIGGKRQECVEWSEKVGYLTGEESAEMQNAHVDSMIALGEPFRPDAPDPYPFADQTITARVKAQIPVMLRHRLTPPPEPTYSLNRKLSGAFLLCARLKANVSCSTMLQGVTQGYVLGNQSSTVRSVGTGRRSIHTFRGSAALLENLQQRQRRRRLENMATRWPRHIVEAMEKQSASENESDSFLSIASTPVSASMASVPPEPNKELHPDQVDLISDPAQEERKRVSDGLPMSAMDLAMNKGVDKPHMIRGVAIPNKPSPPGPEDCCMSGCARCVYDLHLEDLQDYQQDLSVVRNRLLSISPPLRKEEWNVDLLGQRPEEQSVDDRRSAAEKAEAEVDAVIGNLNPSMKAFLQLERSLKKKGTHATS
ncbi:hypothetical protein CBS101457_003533 [Exobasidium rhododendri]|nr:hypothetical protein CBS101457_003533 [Exobasidium rhododendri]